MGTSNDGDVCDCDGWGYRISMIVLGVCVCESKLKGKECSINEINSFKRNGDQWDPPIEDMQGKRRASEVHEQNMSKNKRRAENKLLNRNYRKPMTEQKISSFPA